MSGNDSPPADHVNWEAYSHEELHRMLWQNADVADVSTVADEWTRHRAALATHAEVLREQRTALLADWQGPAAEEAASRLAALADRIEKIGELAAAGERAAQDAADALAMARAAMPPPPGAPPFGVSGAAVNVPVNVPGNGSPFEPPGGPVNAPVNVHGTPPATSPFGSATAPAFAAPPSPPALPTGSAFGTPPGSTTAPAFAAPPAPPALPTAPPAFAAPPAPPAPLALPTAPSFAPAPAFTLPSAPTMPATFSPASFNPATGSGFSFYFGAVSADQQKAQAVRAMQTYESSLNGSSRLIDDARGAVPQAGPQPTSAATPAGTGTAAPTRAGRASTGVPWQRLVGGAAARTPAFAAPAANPAPQLTPGMRAGVMFGPTGGPAAMAGLGADTSARTAAQNGVMPPPGGAARSEDQRHENQMPTLDHGLFELDERACPPVIGEVAGVES